ncbi:hypothetical protein [Halobacteriovorax marinus]|nr:hypothetical protein [Halobacteriovorax marinus]
MKKIIAATLALISVNSFALSSTDSWETIRSTVSASDKYTLSNLTVFVGKPTTVFDVCVDGDKFVALKESPVYERQYVGRGRDHNDGDNDGWADVIVGYKKFSYPLTYTSYREVCANNGKRCRRVPYTVNQKIENTLTVNKLIATYGSSRRGTERKVYKKAFTKSFTVPACN